MQTPRIVITIDGPAASGKSTVADELSRRLGIIHLDTGALYRALAYKAISCGADPKDADQVLPMLDNTDLRVDFSEGSQRCILDGEDVSPHIRSREISAGASDISAIGAVREFLLNTQREIAQEHPVVLDGRDTGSVVLPDAPFKFYITADAEVRALRRYRELEQKGALNGATMDMILDEIRIRDYNDANRAVAPLTCPKDAAYIDTSNMDACEVADSIMDVLRKGGADISAYSRKVRTD